MIQLELELWQADTPGEYPYADKRTMWAEWDGRHLIVRDKCGQSARFLERGARELAAAILAALPPLYGDEASGQGGVSGG